MSNAVSASSSGVGKMTTTIDFPALVKGIREARGLTQEQLAREIEVTFGTVNGWENGKHRPIQALASRLLRMATEAGITPQVPGRNEAQGRRPVKASRGRDR